MRLPDRASVHPHRTRVQGHRTRVKLAIRRIAVALASSCLLAATDASESKMEPKSQSPVSPSEADPSEKGASEQRLAQRIVYRPPALGRPRSRVGGGVRSARRTLPAPRALVPDHVGLTISPQPPLFWFLGEAPPENSWVIFTLVDETSLSPVIETAVEAANRPGIQRIDLADQPIELEPGIEYKWSVAIVEKARRSPLDNVSFGWILRVEAPAGLEPNADAIAFAEQGLWYDALAAASEGREGGARYDRDALLEQVGLRFAAGVAAVPADEFAR